MTVQFLRLLRTVRYLRWSQVARRAERTVRRQLRLSIPGSGLPPTLNPRDCVSKEPFPDIPALRHSDVDDEQTVRLLREGMFHHLHRTEEIGRRVPDWRLGPQKQQRLWTVTLHYHAWAYELAELIRDGGKNSAEATHLLEHYLDNWIRRCDLTVPGAGELAWNPYAIATRLAWWIRCYRLIEAEFFDARPTFTDAFLSSLWRQAQFLHANLEWDLRGNHLLRDAVGLAWAGRFFSGPGSGKWLTTATRLAIDQVREQVLDDGGHFELSPGYQLEIMHDCLSLARLLTAPDAVAELTSIWKRMAEYITWLRGPDGCSPQLNDSAVVRPESLLGWQMYLGLELDLSPRQGVKLFRDAGLVVWHGLPWTVFFDVGNIGPDYQPGHAHADTLTCECSLAGLRLFVDPGCYGYDDDGRRRYDRSTAAHNTVCIDEIDSSEVWHIFRVGRRARPTNVNVHFDSQGLCATASHDGYRHLAGSPTHTRTITGQDHSCLEIADLVAGRGQHVVQGGYLIAPQWNVEATSSGWLVTSSSTRARLHVTADRGVELSIHRRPIHPQYGIEIDTHRLCWSYAGELPVQVVVRVEPL